MNRHFFRILSSCVRNQDLMLDIIFFYDYGGLNLIKKEVKIYEICLLNLRICLR